MAEPNKTPTFNMKVVVQETGIKPDTLRAWERRYGVPDPKRTSGGHRVYSQYEIDMLKWLLARQEEGMSISHAVELWKQMEAEGKNPLQSMPPLEPAPVLAVSGDVVDELRQAWLEACLDFDEYRAQHILAQAFAVYSIETVCFEILQAGLQKVGQGWYEGSVTVQQEHFTSALALRQVEAILAATPPPTREERVIVACPPQELHTFGPLLLALLLRRRGWDVVYLGANVPLERLETAVRSIGPNLAILAAQSLNTAATLLQMADLLHWLNVPLAFGGSVFDRIEAARQRIPGYFLGTELQAAPQAVEQLVEFTPPLPDLGPISEAYQQALDHFREQRAAIEADVHESAHVENLTAVELGNANDGLGDNIEAALTLGDMNFINANIEWLRGLLVNYHDRMPAETIKTYLEAYYEAAQEHLDERGQPILDWFEAVLGSSF
ncbi:MAG TPA: MerR family transcriptional regulator [Anaerolineae bacterium]